MQWKNKGKAKRREIRKNMEERQRIKNGGLKRGKGAEREAGRGRG